MVCEGEHLRQRLLYHGDHFPIHGSSKVHKDSVGWREGEEEEEGAVGECASVQEAVLSSVEESRGWEHVDLR